MEPVLEVLLSVPEGYDYCYLLKCYTVLWSKTTSCSDLWVYSCHFFQVYRLGELHTQWTNWKRVTAQSKLTYTIYFSEHTSFTHIRVLVEFGLKETELLVQTIPSVLGGIEA